MPNNQVFICNEDNESCSVVINYVTPTVIALSNLFAIAFLGWKRRKMASSEAYAMSNDAFSSDVKRDTAASVEL